MTRITRTDLVFVILVGCAVVVNAAGYLLSLWHDETVFDEAVHFFTSFAVVAAIGWLAMRRPSTRGSAPGWWVLVAFGLLLGLMWEAVEWMLGTIGSGHDTVMDLAMDAGGAGAAAALLIFLAGDRARH